MSRILFALPAWGGFLSYDPVPKFDAFFKKALRWGYSCELKCLSDLRRMRFCSGERPTITDTTRSIPVFLTGVCVCVCMGCVCMCGLVLVSVSCYIGLLYWRINVLIIDQRWAT